MDSTNKDETDDINVAGEKDEAQPICIETI